MLRRRRHELLALLELTVLASFVVAQPVFLAFSKSTGFLVSRQTSRVEIVVLVVGLLVVPPVLLWALGGLVRILGPVRQEVVHAALVGGLLGVLALQLLVAATSIPWVVLAVPAALAGAFLGAAYHRGGPARLWVRLASPAPVVFAALFLVFSPVRGLLTPAAAGSSGTSSGGAASPIVVIVLDEFPLVSLLRPEGAIDDRLYPHFGGLAREATFFRNATGVAARTPHALPAMLTGRFPHRSLAPVSSQYPGNLFSLLGSSHRVQAFESVTALCPNAECPQNEWGHSRRGNLWRTSLRLWIRTFSPRANDEPLGTWFEEPTVREEGTSPAEGPGSEDAGFLLEEALADNQPARFIEFLRSLDREPSGFHFLHLVLPHAPWRYLPDGRQYPPRSLGMVTPEGRSAEEWPALVDRQRHVLQAMYVDRLVGQAVERLKEVGVYDDATLLVTADHGISFKPGLEDGTRYLRPGNEHEVAWVPFFLKTPGQRIGEVRDDNVMTVDLTPTIAEIAGVAIPWPLDGISLVSERRRTATKTWFNQPGEPLALSAHPLHQAVLESGLGDLVRPDEGPEGMFAVGPLADMVGASAREHAITEEPGPAVARIADLSAYRTVNVGAGQVPSLLVGHLELPGGTRPAAGVAIAVNGTVAGVSAIYREGDHRQAFAAMITTSHLRSGGNAVEVFLVDEEPWGRVLRQVDVTSA